MLSGRYPSDEFAELRPRVTWDRVNGTVDSAAGRQARRHRQRRHHSRSRPLRRVPRRRQRDGARVGELDEEMVFEARAGETFLLGASTWRIEQITHDRVLVSPAPGEPGKMPFWKGEAAGPADRARPGDRQAHPRAASRRPSRGGRPPQARPRPERAGRRQPAAVPRRPAARHRRRSRRPHPPHRAIAGRDRRLAPLGADALRQPRPRAVGDGGDGAVARRAGPRCGSDVERRRLRHPHAGRRRAARPGAARAGSRRRRAPGGAPARIDGAVRCPLPRSGGPGAAAAAAPARATGAALAAAQARRGSAVGRGAIRVLSDHPRDLPRVPARRLRPPRAGRPAGARAQPQRARRTPWTCRTPSPFAASLLFGYVANYLYDGDAPLAERRAHALSVDQAQLAELIGEGELRDAARSRGAGRTGTRRAAAARAVPRPFHRRRARPVAAPRRSVHGGDRGAISAGGRGGGRRGAGSAPPGAAGEDCRRRPPHRRRGRRPLPRRRRHPAAHRAAGLAARARARRHRRPRAPLRPHARAVHRRRDRRSPRPGRVGGRGDARPAGRARPGRRRRVPARRAGPRVVRRRRAAAGAPALAGGAAQGGRAGRAARARPLPGGVARAGAAAGRTRRAARRRGAAAGRAAGRLACSSARSCRRASTATRRRSSTRWSRPARSPGLASSRWAIATAASRSTSPTTSALLAASLQHRGTARSRSTGAGPAAQGRSIVLRTAARGRRRRLPAGDGRRALGARVEGPGDQRHVASVTGLLRRPRAVAPRGAGATGSARAGWCRRRPRDVGRRRRRPNAPRPRPGRRRSPSNYSRATAW